MFFGRYFPGLGLTAEKLGELAPEETTAMWNAGQKYLRDEAKTQTTHTVGIMRAVARA